MLTRYVPVESWLLALADGWRLPLVPDTNPTGHSVLMWWWA
jgi:hypothetical protein